MKYQLKAVKLRHPINMIYGLCFNWIEGKVWPSILTIRITDFVAFIKETTPKHGLEAQKSFRAFNSLDFMCALIESRRMLMCNSDLDPFLEKVTKIYLKKKVVLIHTNQVSWYTSMASSEMILLLFSQLYKNVALLQE